MEGKDSAELIGELIALLLAQLLGYVFVRALGGLVQNVASQM